MEFVTGITLCISNYEKQIIWTVFLSRAFNFAWLKWTSFCAIMTPRCYLNKRLSNEDTRQWDLLRMRLKEETGTARENTRNVFTGHVKTHLPFFIHPFLPLLLCFQLFILRREITFKLEFCIIIRYFFENTSFFSGN